MWVERYRRFGANAESIHTCQTLVDSGYCTVSGYDAPTWSPIARMLGPVFAGHLTRAIEARGAAGNPEVRWQVANRAVLSPSSGGTFSARYPGSGLRRTKEDRPPAEGQGRQPLLTKIEKGVDGRIITPYELAEFSRLLPGTNLLESCRQSVDDLRGHSRSPTAEEILAAIVQAVRDAGDMLRRQDRAQRVDPKIEKDLETRIEDGLRKTLDQNKSLRNRLHFVVGNAAGSVLNHKSLKDDDFVFVIDAIDGYRLFERGHPNFCVAIGCGRMSHSEGLVPVAAAVSHPQMNDIYIALAGRGGAVVLNELHRTAMPLNPGRRKSPKGALIATHLSTSDSSHLGLMTCLLQDLASSGCRCLVPASGQYALTLLAGGSVDAVLNPIAPLSTMYAGKIIVETASRTTGLVVTDFFGNRWLPTSPGFVAAVPEIARWLKKRIAAARRASDGPP